MEVKIPWFNPSSPHIIKLCRQQGLLILNVFSDFNKMAEKRKFSDENTFGRPKFRTEKFSDKKNPNVFPSESFRSYK